VTLPGNPEMTNAQAPNTQRSSNAECPMTKGIGRSSFVIGAWSFFRH
jgi:hypothetical protein